MPTRPLILTKLIACVVLTSACASTAPVVPPRLTIPPDQPCPVYTLPDSPTEGDLEAGYIVRGSQVATCDAQRRLIRENWLAERAMQDQWQAPKRRFGIF